MTSREVRNRAYRTFSHPRAVVATVAMILGFIMTSAAGQAQTYKILHRFNGTDGSHPQSLILGADGNLYGTTFNGGNVVCNADTTGCGTVFKYSSSGLVTLYNFSGGADGYYPWGQLVRDPDGNIYGINVREVWKVDSAGNQTIVHQFDSTINPGGALVPSKNNILYGVTSTGGDLACIANGCGTVYKLNKNTGQAEIVHTFEWTDGWAPLAGMAQDPAGNLYGTAGGGEFGHGEIFKVDTAGNLTVLYLFQGDSEGAAPISSSVVLDNTGNIYGITLFGGDMNCFSLGCGVVYKLDTAGNYSVLYTFHGPIYSIATQGGGLLWMPDGNLYGAISNTGDPINRLGMIFKIDPSGNFSVVHTFENHDGGVPTSNLVRDAAGNIYGVTFGGGSFGGYGVIFKISF